MEYTPNILEIKLFKDVTSSYTNNWWGKSLRQSIETNGSSELKVLTQEEIELEVLRGNSKEPVTHPAFINGKVPPVGFYHLNVQSTYNMFCGWMNITDKYVTWWGQTGNSDVIVGVAGSEVLSTVSGVFQEINMFVPVTYYVDRFNAETTIDKILTKF